MNEVTLKPKPYALVTLESLTIKRFDSKDDWKAAMDAIQAREDFIAMKYHHGSRRYVVLDRYQ